MQNLHLLLWQGEAILPIPKYGYLLACNNWFIQDTHGVYALILFQFLPPHHFFEDAQHLLGFWRCSGRPMLTLWRSSDGMKAGIDSLESFSSMGAKLQKNWGEINGYC